MRILRRRSNLEVSSKGFALFVAGLLVATFLGGAVRTILSSERVHQRIVRELKKRFPKNQIEIGRTEVLLSRGIWPGVGLRVRDLTVGQDRCGKLSFLLAVPEAVLPLSLLALRTGRVRLGEIEVPGGRVDLDFHACAKPGEDDPPDAPSLRQTVQARGIRPPRLDWSDVADALEGVSLSDFEVNFKRTPQWKLKLQHGRVRFGRELRVNAALEVQRSLPFGTLAHPVTVTSTGRAGEIEWQVTSELKEGRLRWTGAWNLAENTATAQAQMTQIPLKELALELFQIGVLPRELKFKSAWLSCGARWAGPLSEPFASPIELNSCHVEGGYGRAQLEHAEVFADRPKPFPKPAEIRVQRAQLQGLAEAAGAKILSGVLARPGSWTGGIIVSGADDWTALGRLDDVEIAFSNQSVHGKQLVSGVDVRARREADQLAVTLDGFGLVEGSCRGRVDLRYGIAKRAGTLDVRLSELTLSPAIQTLLVGGKLGAMDVNGIGTLTNGAWSAWDGRAHAGLITGEGWRIDGVDAQVDYRGDAFVINARAARANVDSHWRYFGDLQSVWPDAGEDFAWRDVAGKLALRRDGGQIFSLTAAPTGAANAKGEWRGRGEWRRDGELFATLKPGPRAPGVRLRGERGLLTITSE